MDAATVDQIPPLQVYFAQFIRSGFRYNVKHTAHHNFNRLCNIARWPRKSLAEQEARSDFNDALVQQFNFIFGTNNNLASWQNLCSAIETPYVPNRIKECRKLVWDAHINIIDLLESVRMKRPVRKFATLEDLRAYTLEKPWERMFPKESAYAGGLLKELLRELINPYFGKRQNGSAKRKAKKNKALRRKQAQATAEDGDEQYSD